MSVLFVVCVCFCWIGGGVVVRGEGGVLGPGACILEQQQQYLWTLPSLQGYTCRAADLLSYVQSAVGAQPVGHMSLGPAAAASECVVCGLCLFLVGWWGCGGGGVCGGGTWGLASAAACEYAANTFIFEAVHTHPWSSPCLNITLPSDPLPHWSFLTLFLLTGSHNHQHRELLQAHEFEAMTYSVLAAVPSAATAAVGSSGGSSSKDPQLRLLKVGRFIHLASDTALVDKKRMRQVRD